MCNAIKGNIMDTHSGAMQLGRRVGKFILEIGDRLIQFALLIVLVLDGHFGYQSIQLIVGQIPAKKSLTKLL